MAATEVIVVCSLQQPISPAIPTNCSRNIISIKPLHLSFELGRPNYKSRHNYLPVNPQASAMASKDNDGAPGPRRKEYAESGHINSRGSVSSLLRAVREGGSNAVMQQVSSIRHFFMPELPHAIITEIKKMVPLSFRGEEEEEIPNGSDGMISLEEKLEEHLHVMGPRCAWPRSKLVIGTEQSRLQEDMPGPRCAWPRGAAQALNAAGIISSMQGARNSYSTEEIMDRSVVLNSSSSAEEQADKLENGSCKTLQAPSNDVIEGPRCAWPRPTTPRRMLTTGVGLGLMNYLFIGQGGAPALAILLESPLPISYTTWEEKYASVSTSPDQRDLVRP